MLDSQYLSILREVERMQSLTAAEKLHVTQLALNHTIRKLEKCNVVVMREKDGRNLRLSEAGHYVLTPGHRPLSPIGRAEDI
ncbi:helix-turn-helix domain-containing protein [Ochrobactrum sp. BTU1]|jgi:LysR family transcriptional regulator for metE and metH|uniref:helix-turn-helix domain-containing protein n=1 Tax=Ochrobactrum sp. BTU1 TaxID=2840456 RepID=UPI00207B13BD